MEKNYDIRALDYEKRLKPIKGRSLMIGVALASTLYAIGFFLGLYAINNQTITNEIFVKMSWYLIVPSTMIGMVAWMLTRNKHEFALRDELKRYIKRKEDENGLIWRFSPVFASLDPNDSTSKQVCQLSREKKFDELLPDDYLHAVQSLYKLLAHSEKNALSEEVLAEVEANLKQKES